jgi:hypothetical protein
MIQPAHRSINPKTKKYVFMYMSAAVMLFAVYSVVRISRVYVENQSIVDSKTEVIEQLKEEKNETELFIEFQKNSGYIEMEIRKRFNYRSQGEIVLTKPNLLQVAQTDRAFVEQNPDPEPKKSNFEQWMDLLLGRD